MAQARPARTADFDNWVSSSISLLGKIMDGEDYLNESGSDWKEAEEAFLLVKQASHIFERLRNE